MGGVVSSDTNLEENAVLRRFTGLETISDNDPFWNQLLSFNMKVDHNNRKALASFDESVSDLLQALMYNTQTTGNFAACIRVFLRRAAELKTSAQCDNKIFLWQSGNALLILRCVCKFLTQRLSESEFINVFNKNALVGDDERFEFVDDGEQFENTAVEFLHALIEILVDLNVDQMTLPIHIEAVQCLLAILSSQLYHDNVQQHSLFFNYLMTGKCAMHASALTKALLKNYLLYNTPYEVGTRTAQAESIVLGFAASMWSAVQHVTGFDDGVATGGETSTNPITLGGVSILLLLNLACHHTTKEILRNPYRETLAAFHNAQEVSTPTTHVTTFKLDYCILYDRLCATVDEQPPMLLLYLLLHRNAGFRNYVLSRVNLENLVLPVLRVLNGAAQPASNHASIALLNSHHIYLALIVILILSEDEFFCKIVHETMIKNVDWLQMERPLSEISLGGLIALIFIRTIQLNTVKTRDRYLHTNCLAALANMSTHFKQLSPFVCQKLIALLELLTKRHAKLVEQMRLSAEYDLPTADSQTGTAHNYHQDINAIEEGIRTLLEMCNSCLSANLRHNPHLVYTILYKRDLFDAFHEHPMFQDLIWNISAVVNHFATRVQSLEKDASVSQVLAVIEKGVLQWPSDRLKKFPELKFKYVEDDNTVDFFVPYVWRLTYQYSSLYWDPTRIRLFTAMGIF